MEKSKTILVADDDQDYRFQLRLQLEADGYTVVEADSMESGRNLLEASELDAAIVDLMMEELDAGFTLCYYIKKKNPGLPVILVTAVARESGIEFDATTQEEQSWIKADALLPKPVRYEQIKRELGRFLEN